MDDIRKSILKDYTVDGSTLEKDLYDFASMLSKLKLTEGDEKA